MKMVANGKKAKYCGINFVTTEKFRKHQRNDPELKHLYKVSSDHNIELHDIKFHAEDSNLHCI